MENSNCKSGGGARAITRKSSPGVLCGKWLQIAVLTSTSGAPFIDCETMLSPTPPHRRRFTSHPQLLGVCVFGWLSKCHRATQPPWGETDSKHAEYRLGSDANQFLSYATADLWWTLRRWMLPGPSIEISGPQRRRHISYGFSAGSCALPWNE